MTSSSLGRRAFINFLLPTVAIILAPLNARARETAINALKRYSSATDVEMNPLLGEDQSSLEADLIMDALDNDPDLRAEIIDWLVSNYFTECQAAIADTNLGIA
jgi:hypothetical protein